MAEILASKRGNVPYADCSGGVRYVPFEWDVVAASNNDTVHIGELPAGHRLIPELIAVIADGSTPAFTYSLCVDSDANAIIAGDAITASTFKRTALSLFQLASQIGVSSVNRKIYLKLTTAPTTSGGKLTAQIAYAAATP